MQLNPPNHARKASRRAWGSLLLFAGILFALRVAYLIWLCPYELAADEAQYWDWSRRLDLSYYSKGPGVAWVIALSTRLLGTAEWTVRLPAAGAAFAATLAVGGLALAVSGGNRKAGLSAAALFNLSPVFQGTAQFMTIDSPFFMCWVSATWLGWVAAERPSTHAVSVALWSLLGIIVGVGFLFKYTMLLWIPGFVGWLALRGRGAPRPAARTACLVAAVLACAAAISPVLVWNAQHGWPTVSHLLGHAALPGGDIQARPAWRYNPVWTLTYLLSPLVVLGPTTPVLILVALRRSWRGRATDRRGWDGALYTLCCAAPLLLFYLFVSLASDIELNWPVAGHAALLVPAACLLAGSATQGMRRLWRTTVAFGILAAVVMAIGTTLIPPLASLGGSAGRDAGDRLMKRVAGNRMFAATVSETAARAQAVDGQAPLFIASRYGKAALLAFYGHGRPTVFSAASMLGSRESSYDYFADTNLSDPALRGKSAVLVGANLESWALALDFETVRRANGSVDIFVGTGYKGPLKPRKHR